MVERPSPLGRRGAAVLVLLLAGVVAWAALGLAPSWLIPRAGGARIAREFLAAALEPALTYESALIPSGTQPFLLRLFDATHRTLTFALAAMSIAAPAGLALGVLASRRWWAGDPAQRGRARTGAALQRGAKLAATLLRSVHELLWAIVFLAALGISDLAAVAALALPATGILAKVFAELFDEVPADADFALRAAGAGPLQAFLFGVLPRALPDMAAYAFYRFECAVRSSAVLGFFGYATLGHHLKLSFESLHYREVWTYLYVLVALVLLLEAWSGSVRRRFVA